jgi:YcaO-like protein with predicted kinase domain
MRIGDQDLAQAKGWIDGTHRTRSPAQTVADYGRHMARLGITRLANVTGLDVIGLPVWVAIRPTSRGLSVSQGKGLDHDAARASALMESIESWHAERVERPMRWESYDALRRIAPAVDVRQVPARAGSVVRTDVPLLWVEGWDLVEGEPCWVPFESVTTNFVTPARGNSTFLMSSNGLSSGNHLLEAIAHALCEVIERDALTLWHLLAPDASKACQLDVSTIDDPGCVATIARLAEAGVGVAAWDITSDADVPAYCAVIHEAGDRPRWRPMGMFSGYGCHLAPGVALLRALTEAVQSRLTMISGSRDDLFYRDYVHCSNPDDLAQMIQRVTTPPPARDFRGRAAIATASFEDDLAALLARLRRIGVERAVAVDLTRAELGIPVVKVVVPGLEAMSLAHTYAAGPRARAARGVPAEVRS